MDLSDVLARRRLWQVVRGEAVRTLQALPDESVDTFVTDPPYGINLCLNWAGRKRVLGDGRLEARTLWRRWVPEAYRAAKPDTAHLIFGTWKSPWMHSVLARHFAVKGCIVWFKSQWGLGHHLRPRWELAYLCHKGKPPTPAKADHDVWEHAREGRTLHPCQKPPELLRRGIRLTLPAGTEGRLVCDPFAGVFSTGVAALAEGCRFLGVELDAKYCDLGRGRLEGLGGTAAYG